MKTKAKRCHTCGREAKIASRYGLPFCSTACRDEYAESRKSSRKHYTSEPMRTHYLAHLGKLVKV